MPPEERPKHEDLSDLAPARRRLVVQPKMTVGTVDDPAEHEADAIAALTVARLAAARTQAPAPTETTDGRIRRASLSTGTADPGGLPVSPDIESSIRGSSGQPLERAVRTQFESAMGTDLGAVRIHRSAKAADLNRSLQAKAFTAGNDVFFSAGSYRPGTTEGQHLLAHELAHTIQQQPRVRRQVIRRFSLSNADFTKTTAVNVFQKGGSGNVAQFDDGGTPLIVKVDQLIGNEVVAAGNLHSASAQQSGGSGGFSVQSPGVRLATTKERGDIAAATTRLLKPTDSPRNFLTGINSSKPVVIMEKASGQDFKDILTGGGHTKKGMFGKTTGNKDSIVFQIATKPGPLTALAQQVPADVIMGMFDRLIGLYNPDNFRYDATTQTFGFVDNTQNSDAGFITTVDLGKWGIHTNQMAFTSWAKSPHVKKLATDTTALAKSMFDTFIGVDTAGGMAFDLDNQGEVGVLFRAAVKKNRSKMLGWIKSGIDTGKASVMSQLANPLPLVNGIGDAQKPEAVQSMLAKLYVLQGTSPAQAWTDAATAAQALLPPAPNVPVPTATPNTTTSATPPARPTSPPPGGTGTGSSTGTGWKSAQPAGKWQSAQPAGRWKRATPSGV